MKDGGEGSWRGGGGRKGEKERGSYLITVPFHTGVHTIAFQPQSTTIPVFLKLFNQNLKRKRERGKRWERMGGRGRRGRMKKIDIGRAGREGGNL